jgi:tetratricopeptide (TPR) repeat protein
MRVVRRARAVGLALSAAVGIAVSIAGAQPSLDAQSPAGAQGWVQEAASGYQQVQRAFLAEDFEAVIPQAQAFLSQEPEAAEAPRVWIWLAISLDRLERSNEALHELTRLKQRLVPGTPLWSEALFWEGEISRRAFQMARAGAAYRQLVRRDPASTWAAQARLGLGLMDMHHQDFASAIQHFRDVRVRHGIPSLSRHARQLEGLCDLKLERFTEAAAIFASLLAEEAQAASPPAAVTPVPLAGGGPPLPPSGASPPPRGGVPLAGGGPPLASPSPPPRGGVTSVAAQTAFYLGESLSGQGRFAEARQAFRRAMEADPSSSWAHAAQFGLGWAAFQTDRCEEAVEPLARYLAQPAAERRTEVTFTKARWSEATFARASCLVQLGRDQDALAGLEQLVSRHPEHPLALEGALALADIYRRQGRLTLAKALLDSIQQRSLDPAIQARWYRQRVAVALEEGRAEPAREVLLQGVRHAHPAIRQAALNGLGDVAVFLGDLAEAHRRYEAARLVDPATTLADYADYQIGRIALQQERLEEASAAFQRLAAHAEPELAGEAQLSLVLVYLTQQRLEAAHALLDRLRAEEGSPSAPFAASTGVEAPPAAPTGADAPSTASSARSGHTRQVAARAAYYEALLALDAGRDDAARRLCEETVAAAPFTDEALQAHLVLAELLAREDGPRQAMARLRHVVSRSSWSRPQRAQVTFRLGEWAHRATRYAEAIRWFDAAIELLPALQSEILYRIASCYEEGGDEEVAVRWYRAIAQPPWQVRGQMAAAKLLERQGRIQEALAVYARLAEEPIPEAAVIQERMGVLRSGVRAEGR